MNNWKFLVSKTISDRASRLLKFEWFLDSGTPDENCKYARLKSDFGNMKLVKSLEQEVFEIDHLLTYFATPDTHVHIAKWELLIEGMDRALALLNQLYNRLQEGRLPKTEAARLVHEYAILAEDLKSAVYASQREGDLCNPNSVIAV